MKSDNRGWSVGQVLEEKKIFRNMQAGKEGLKEYNEGLTTKKE